MSGRPAFTSSDRCSGSRRPRPSHRLAGAGRWWWWRRRRRTTRRQRLLRAALEGLRGAPVRVLAATDRRAARAPIRAGRNARLVNWMSYPEAMSDAALVICHGGHGTVARALEHGVPVLVVPHSGDMAENAARIDWAGVGVRLPWRLLSARTLRLAVERALEEHEALAARAGRAGGVGRGQRRSDARRRADRGAAQLNARRPAVPPAAGELASGGAVSAGTNRADSFANAVRCRWVGMRSKGQPTHSQYLTTETRFSRRAWWLYLAVMAADRGSVPRGAAQRRAGLQSDRIQRRHRDRGRGAHAQARRSIGVVSDRGRPGFLRRGRRALVQLHGVLRDERCHSPRSRTRCTWPGSTPARSPGCCS